MSNIAYIKFEMDGCAPCKMSEQFINKETSLKHSLLTNYDTQTVLNSEVLNVVNVGDNPEIAAHFEIAGVPTFIKLVDGIEVERFSGFQPPKLKQIELDLQK